MSEVTGQFVKATVDVDMAVFYDLTYPPSPWYPEKEEHILKGPAAGKLTGCEDDFEHLQESLLKKKFS